MNELTPAQIEAERAAFEAKYEKPYACIWTGSGYEVREAYEGHRGCDLFCARWAGWLARAEIAGKAAPVAWQWRWLNPGGQDHVTAEELAWRPVEPRGSESMEDRVRELEAYRYGGKPCYEVRPLYTSAPQDGEAFDVVRELVEAERLDARGVTGTLDEIAAALRAKATRREAAWARARSLVSAKGGE